MCFPCLCRATAACVLVRTASVSSVLRGYTVGSLQRLIVPDVYSVVGSSTIPPWTTLLTLKTESAMAHAMKREASARCMPKREFGELQGLRLSLTSYLDIS